MLEMEVYHKRLDSNCVRLGQVEIQGFENIYACVPFVIKKGYKDRTRTLSMLTFLSHDISCI